MATKTKMTIPFVAMTTINKKASYKDDGCADWVATEKVHGSSFQFFTNDGNTVYPASRRNVLNPDGTFLKCNLTEFRQRHQEYVRRMFQIIQTNDRWKDYRTMNGLISAHNDDEEDENEDVEDGAAETNVEKSAGEWGTTAVKVHGDDQEIQGKTTRVDGKEKVCTGEGETSETFENVEESERKRTSEEENGDNKSSQNESVTELRIYGELYGGGGVNKDIKPAVQKEIIYCDEFRFYVFGVNINRRWVTIAEMNDLCKEAGFPYYAIPVCEPKATLDELIDWLSTSGFMTSKSQLTERNDNYKTLIEGVVMSPLTRKDYRFHPIKLLSNAFNDVRPSGNKGQKPNYFTKARYYSVISKLDLHEREDADMVAQMFIEDILKESGESEVSKNKTKSWTKAVKGWLAKDGYIKLETEQAIPQKTAAENENNVTSTDGESHETKAVNVEAEGAAGIEIDASISGIVGLFDD